MESYGTLDKDELISRTWMNVEEGPSHNSKEIHKYYEHCLNWTHHIVGIEQNSWTNGKSRSP